MPPRKSIDVDDPGFEDDFISDEDDLYDDGKSKKGKGKSSGNAKKRSKEKGKSTEVSSLFACR
jgi:hypothetical protein